MKRFKVKGEGGNRPERKKEIVTDCDRWCLILIVSCDRGWCSYVCYRSNTIVIDVSGV